MHTDVSSLRLNEQHSHPGPRPKPRQQQLHSLLVPKASPRPLTQHVDNLWDLSTSPRIWPGQHLLFRMTCPLMNTGVTALLVSLAHILLPSIKFSILPE